MWPVDVPVECATVLPGKVYLRKSVSSSTLSDYKYWKVLIV